MRELYEILCAAIYMSKGRVKKKSMEIPIRGGVKPVPYFSQRQLRYIEWMGVKIYDFQKDCANIFLHHISKCPHISVVLGYI